MLYHDKNKQDMALSNHTIVALGILTRRAKKTVGFFKTTDILEDEQQAYALMTQTILSGDDELVSLTIELNKSLKIAPNMMLALLNYMALMQAESRTETYINQHRNGLKTFTKHLYHFPVSNHAYRQAADAYLAEEPTNHHSFCLDLIRKFYAFWCHAHHLESDYKLNKTTSQQQENDAFLDLWETLDSKFLTTIEESVLKAYIHAIQAIHIKEDQITLRTKLAKLIMIKQRDFARTAEGYRKNVEHVKHHFTNDALHQYFLSVSREFYSIWSKTQMAK